MGRGLSKQQRALLEFLSGGEIRTTRQCAAFLAFGVLHAATAIATTSQRSSAGRALHSLAEAGLVGKIENRHWGIGDTRWALKAVAVKETERLRAEAKPGDPERYRWG